MIVGADELDNRVGIDEGYKVFSTNWVGTIAGEGEGLPDIFDSICFNTESLSLNLFSENTRFINNTLQKTNKYTILDGI